MIKTYISIFLFFIIIMILHFYSGKWLYLDTSLIPNNIYRYNEYFHYFISTISGESYFGFNSIILNFTRLLNNILLYFNQITIYIVFFTLSLFIGYKTFRLKFNKEISIIGGIIYSINPISLYFIQEISFAFSYFSLFLIIFFTVKYFTKGGILNFIGLSFGYYFLLSYPRITGIYLLLLIFLFFLNLSFFIKIYRKNKKKIFYFLLINIILFFPFLFLFLFPYLSGEKDYFLGLGNYSDFYKSSGSYLYTYINNQLFFTLLYFKEITNNYGLYIQGNILYIIFMVFSFFGVIIGFSLKKIKSKNDLLLLLFLLFIMFIQVSPKFLDKGLFIDISYSYFPFIANNLSWLLLITFPIILYYYLIIINNKRLFKILGIIFILFSIAPFLYNNEKLKTIDIKKDLPINYQKTFYKSSIERNATLIFPENLLKFTWSPYPFEIRNNTIYQTLFISNIRLVNSKQKEINLRLNNLKYKNNLQNLSIFNLKNIFVFKDIENIKEGQFDYFLKKDYIKESKEYYEKFKNNQNLYIKQNNENFAQFGLKNDNKFEYFLYSPAKISRLSINDFFKHKIDINKKPVIVDPTSFHKPKDIDNFKIQEENKHIKFTYKKSVLNPTKIYLKIEYVDTTKPFMLQLNQTFGMSWKIKWIDKKDFEEKKCENTYKKFPITENSYCLYKSTLLNIKDTKYLFKKEVNEKNHFEGNFVGNSWLVKSNDIPEKYKNKKELYAVIIYEKQIYYIWALIISGLTFLVLILLSIIELFRDYKKRKNDKK